MPVSQWKNELYTGAVNLLRPFNSRGRHTLGDGLDTALPLIRRRQLQAATLRYGAPGAPACEVRSGCPAPPPPGAFYHVASIAKMVTALGALRLSAAGVLPLDAPVGDYSRLPIPPHVTLRQLLSHTSGILDGPGYGEAIARRRPLGDFINAPGFLSGEAPGTCLQYSNLGFGLVGSLMEEATGESLQALMARSVFSPLGMAAVYDLTALPEGAFVVSSRRLFPPGKGYALDGPERLKKAIPLMGPDPLTHYGLAAGGLFAAAGAIEKLLVCLASEAHGLLPFKEYQLMLSPTALQDFGTYRCGFGLGIFCLESRRGLRVYGHQGFAYGGVQGAFWRPDTRAWAVSLNGGGDESRLGRLGRTNLDIIQTLLGGGLWM